MLKDNFLLIHHARKQKTILQKVKTHLFNGNGNLVIRQEDRGNKLFTVPTIKVKAKAKKQIEKISFAKLDRHHTQDPIQNVTLGAKKCFSRKQISKN